MGSTWIVWIGYSKSFNYLHFIAFLSQKEAVFVSNCNAMRNGLIRIILSVKIVGRSKPIIDIENDPTFTEIKFYCALVGYERRRVLYVAEIEPNSHCWVLSTSINRFVSCFESETFNNTVQQNITFFFHLSETYHFL